MLAVKKKYVVNEKHERVAAQLDLDTWTKIEELLEDRLLGKKMREARREQLLEKEAALKYYATLKTSVIFRTCGEPRISRKSRSQAAQRSAAEGRRGMMSTSTS